MENITFSLRLTSSDVSLSDRWCYEAVLMEPVVLSLQRCGGVSLRFTEASINTHCLAHQKKHSSLIGNHVIAESRHTKKNIFPFKKTYIDFGTCECMKWASRSKTALLKAQRSRKANLHGDPLTSLQQSVCGLTQREMFFRKATIKFILSTCFEWHLRRPTDSCKSDVYVTWPDRNDMYTTSSFVFSPCLFVVKLNTKSFYLKWHFT